MEQLITDYITEVKNIPVFEFESKFIKEEGGISVMITYQGSEETNWEYITISLIELIGYMYNKIKK